MLWILFWLVQNLAPGSVAGALIQAGTGQPLSGLVVELRPAGLTSRSDAAGRFDFPRVPPGHYTLVVEESNFRANIRFSLEPGQRIDEAVVRVHAAPGIFGTVFDANGERLAAARVDAFQMVYTPTGRRLHAVKSVFSDDLGDYRLFWLRPGEYYVAARYLETDRRSAVSGFLLSPNVAQRDDSFTTIYFGGSFTPAESQRVRLKTGSEASGINLYFREGPRYFVRGQLLGPNGPACARVSMVPEGGIFNDDTDFTREICGAFVIPNVSPGAYVLIAKGQGIASDIIRVNVSRDVAGLGVPLSPTVDLEGSVSGDAWRGVANLKVVLTRSGKEIEQKFEAAVNASGRFTVLGVAPGDYDVLLDPLPENAYVRTMRMLSRDVLATRLRVGNDRGRLEISLTSGGGSLEGVVKDRNGKAAAGAQVVLVPTTMRHREDRYKVAVSDLKGNYRVTAIPPGGYVAFAFEALEPGLFYAFAYNQSLFAQYAGKGMAVTLGDFRQQTAHLTAVPAEETSGGIE
jgi:hypothetical protein